MIAPSRSRKRTKLTMAMSQSSQFLIFQPSISLVFFFMLFEPTSAIPVRCSYSLRNRVLPTTVDATAAQTVN